MTDAEYEQYHNDIDEWFESPTNPVKNFLDDKFSKFIKKNRKKTKLVLDDFTSPVQLELSGWDITLSIFGIHDTMHENYEDAEPLFFDKKEWSTFSDFDSLMYSLFIGEKDDLTIEFKSKELDAMALAILGDNVEELFDIYSKMSKSNLNKIEELEIDSDEYKQTMYTITTDEQYLLDDAREMFLF